jgi:hypothetical protein
MLEQWWFRVGLTLKLINKNSLLTQLLINLQVLHSLIIKPIQLPPTLTQLSINQELFQQTQPTIWN